MVLPAAVLVNRSERGLLIIEARKTDFGPRSGCEGCTRSLFPAPSAKRGFREGEDRTAKLRRQVSGLQELDEGCLSTLEDCSVPLSIGAACRLLMLPQRLLC